MDKELIDLLDKEVFIKGTKERAIKAHYLQNIQNAVAIEKAIEILEIKTGLSKRQIRRIISNK